MTVFFRFKIVRVASARTKTLHVRWRYMKNKNNIWFSAMSSISKRWLGDVYFTLMPQRAQEVKQKYWHRLVLGNKWNRAHRLICCIEWLGARSNWLWISSVVLIYGHKLLLHTNLFKMLYTVFMYIYNNNIDRCYQTPINSS